MPEGTGPGLQARAGCRPPAAGGAAGPRWAVSHVPQQCGDGMRSSSNSYARRWKPQKLYLSCPQALVQSCSGCRRPF